VNNSATEVEARVLGARAHRPVLLDGRSPARQPMWGIEGIESYPYDGSAIVVWDSGAPAPPVGNIAPSEGKNPHDDPRSSPQAREQKSQFLKRNGRVVDVCGRQPCSVAP
jgi:hypothetical protein